MYSKQSHEGLAGGEESKERGKKLSKSPKPNHTVKSNSITGLNLKIEGIGSPLYFEGLETAQVNKGVSVSAAKSGAEGGSMQEAKF